MAKINFDNLMLEFEPTKRVHVGMSGSGKTLLSNDFIAQSKYDFVFVYDHDGQFCQRNRMRPALDDDGILQAIKESGFVVFYPTEMFSDLTEGFEWFCRYIYLMSEKAPLLVKKTKLLYCTEIQDIVPLRSIGLFTSKIIVSGRNRGIDVLFESLQYNMIHNTIRGQMTQTFAFMSDEALALEALADRGFKPDEIRNLKKGEYVCRDKRGCKEFRGKVDRPWFNEPV